MGSLMELGAPTLLNIELWNYYGFFECPHVHSRVCGPHVVTLLNWTPILEWYRGSLVVKNGPKMIHATIRLNYVLKIY